MSDIACIWRGTESPRALRGRHDDGCDDDQCRGCQPCLEPHCWVCARAHADGTCAECTAEARDDLRTIGALCGALPAEAINRGTDSEAMMLLGPTADPEAWGHLSASLAVGRLPEGYLAEADGELHPLFVLGTWDMVWRDALDHDEPTGRLDVATAVDYLDRQLTYMAGFGDVPFSDFAHDLRRCRAHLESVLHDGEQRDTGAPCMRCDVPLHKCWKGRELPWSTAEHKLLAKEDGWACPRCKRWHNETQYRLAVAHEHVAKADHLTAADMAIRTGLNASTIRRWASRRFVRTDDDGEPIYTPARLKSSGHDANGRKVYRVDDVLDLAGRGRVA